MGRKMRLWIPSMIKKNKGPMVPTSMKSVSKEIRTLQHLAKDYTSEINKENNKN